MDLREIIKKDLEYQERLSFVYKKGMKGLPKGTLYVKTNRGKEQYYFVDAKSKKRKYIKAKDVDFVYGLKKRRFMEETIKAIDKNIAAQKRFLSVYTPYDYASITDGIPIAYRLENSSMDLNEENKVERINKGNQTLLHYDNEILHETTIGLKVRSKAEAIICEALVSNNVDFEYEKELILFKEGNQITVRPDFSFENKITGERFYLEHLGMLNDGTYRRKNIEKLILYAENDIQIGRNLFITSDSMRGEIDVRAIMRTIEFIKGLL